MNLAARPDAVVFDLDGTLVDTVPARIRAWREVLARHDIGVTDETLQPMIGMDGRQLARDVAGRAGRTLEDDDAELIDREAGERFEELNDRPRALPGVHGALERLDARGITWAIATSSRAEQVAGSVRALGLDHGPRIVDGSRVEQAKPAPDLLLLSARELGVPAGRCWYVGDSTWDMMAAVAAGMTAIGVLAGAAVSSDDLADAGAATVLQDLAGLDVPA